MNSFFHIENLLIKTVVYVYICEALIFNHGEWFVFKYGSVVKNLPASAGDMGSILGPDDPLEKEMVTQLQQFCLRNPMDRGAWQVIAHGVTKSQTQLSD